MNQKEIIEFAQSNPASWVATSVMNQPHVRGMLLWFADETGFYYHTASCKQLALEFGHSLVFPVSSLSNAPKKRRLFTACIL
ncbi:MAG: hypothetical protein JXR23_00070, partial [Pontiellaceae bacterium]|nr:hypothetical protein [Pontiellaceae bacterium]